MKNVYLRRRLAVLLVLLLILIAGGFFLIRFLNPSTEPKPAAPTPTTEAPVADQRCTSDQIALVATSDRDSYAADQLPAFRISVRNTKAQQCRMNVGTAAQSYRILKGSQLVWDSKVCLVEPKNALIMLLPNQTVTSQSLTWQREISSFEDCGKEMSKRPHAEAGEYTLEVAVDGFGPVTYKFVLQ